MLGYPVFSELQYCHQLAKTSYSHTHLPECSTNASLASHVIVAAELVSTCISNSIPTWAWKEYPRSGPVHGAGWPVTTRWSSSLASAYRRLAVAGTSIIYIQPLAWQCTRPKTYNRMTHHLLFTKDVFNVFFLGCITLGCVMLYYIVTVRAE
jgi:hypothetical protein